jgi:UDP-N-acetyl-D-glucosamine dehydrogenase
MPFYPGPGLGGHCIPVDPFYLTWKAREYHQGCKFVELAGEINTAMPEYVVTRIGEALNAYQKAINGSHILIVGVAYKSNVGDDREAPSYRIIELLAQRGARIAYHDSHVPKLREEGGVAKLGALTSIEWKAEVLAKFDCAVIVTPHRGIDFEELVRSCSTIVDTRNALAHFETAPGQVWKA